MLKTISSSLTYAPNCDQGLPNSDWRELFGNSHNQTLLRFEVGEGVLFSDKFHHPHFHFIMFNYCMSLTAPFMDLEKCHQVILSQQLDKREWNMCFGKPKANFWIQKVNTIRHFYILLTLDNFFSPIFLFIMPWTVKIFLIFSIP